MMMVENSQNFFFQWGFEGNFGCKSRQGELFCQMCFIKGLNCDDADGFALADALSWAVE